MGANDRVATNPKPSKYTVELQQSEARHLGVISAMDNRTKRDLLEEYCRRGIQQRAMELNIKMSERG